jgi:hypothetical protein
MKPALCSLLVGASLVASLPRLGPDDVKDKQAIVKQARAAYYNLPRLGVTGYRCEVLTDWRTMLGNLADPDALKTAGGQQGLKALESVHFWMTVDKNGDPKFTKKIDDVEADGRVEDWTAQLAAKQEPVLTHTAHELRQQLIIGMLRYPDESYTLEEKQGGYLISMTEGSSRLTIRMGTGLQDRRFYDFTSDSTVSIAPQYIETAQDFIMSGQRIETHTNPRESGTESQLLEYSDVGGVRIPTKITTVVVLDRAPDKKPRRMVLSFQGCQLQKAN